MATLESSEDSSYDDSPDYLIKHFLNNRSNVCVQKSLYDFQSVEYSFNVKLLKKPINNIKGQPPDLVDNLIIKPTASEKVNNSQPALTVPNADPVVQIMLPRRISQNTLRTRNLGEIISAPKSMPVTPIQLFKYSRFNRNINNFSTPKGSTKTSIFTCPISPIGIKFRRYNSPNEITKSSLGNGPIKDVNKSVQNIRQDDNKTRYGFHSQNRPSSNQKTITTSKYMSLASITSRKERYSSDTSDSTRSEGTMIMSISNAETKPSNSQVSDVSSSSSTEIPNINDETSFYLGRILTDVNKQTNVENIPRGPVSSSEDSSGITIERTNIQQSLINKGNDDKLDNISTEQDQFIITEGAVPPYSSSVESDFVGFSNDLTISTSDQEKVPQMNIIKDIRKEATVSNESIKQYQISITEKMDSVIQPPFNNIVELDRSTEESVHQIQIINTESPKTNRSLKEHFKNDLRVINRVSEERDNSIPCEQNSITCSVKGMSQSVQHKSRASTKPKSIIYTSEKRKSFEAKLDADTRNNKLLSILNEELVRTIDINNESPRLSSQKKIDELKHSSEIRLNCNSMISQTNSTTICTPAVRRSARINKYISNSVKSTTTKQKVVKVKRNARNVLKVIEESTNIIQQNSLPTSNSIFDPRDKSQSNFKEQSEFDSYVNTKNCGLLNVSDLLPSINLETGHLSLSSKPNYVITNTSKGKSSKIKAKTKSNLKLIDQKTNKSNSTVQQNFVPRKGKSVTSKSIIEPRRSSRARKPLRAYWLNGPRPIIPVIRNVDGLANNYDSRIPILLLPPKILSANAFEKLLRQIRRRML